MKRTICVIVICSIVAFGFKSDSGANILRGIRTRMVHPNPVQAAIGGLITVDAPVTFTKSVSTGSYTFFDSANPQYYIAPANSDISLVVLGKVGIGTTSPNYKLQISGPDNSPALSIGGTLSNNEWTGIQFGYDLEGSTKYHKVGILFERTGANAIGSLHFATDNTADNSNVDLSDTRMTITNAGLVGIGTTQPILPLSIVANGTTSTTYMKSGAYSTVFSVFPWNSTTYISSGIYYKDGAWVHASDTTYNILFALNNAATGGARWYASDNSTYSWNLASGVVLWDNSSYWKSLVRSTASGDSYFTGGKVGIGTTTPTSLLTLKNTPSNTPVILYVDNNNNEIFRISAPSFDNLFIGHNAGGSTPASGNSNTAIGYETLDANTSGYQNSAVGYQALTTNTTGAYNSAFGYSALSVNNGNYNSAFGASALALNSTGINNNAFGYDALFNNTTGASNNAFGYSALETNTTGYNNSAVGNQALNANTAGHNNNAFGFFALSHNTTGSYNNAFGNNALYWNTTASYSNAFGHSTLVESTGAANNAFGYQALTANTTGTHNIAFGYQALFANETGIRNIAIGSNALYINNGVAANGSYNVAVGYGSMLANTYGYGNVGLGYSALADNTTGLYNIAVGWGAGPAAATPALNHTIALGYDSLPLASNEMRFSPSQTSYYMWGTWTNASDRRLKKNITDYAVGLDFIKNLKPVSYELINESEDRIGKRYEGFIAQDVEEAMNTLHVQFGGLYKPPPTAPSDSPMGISYERLVVPLVNAVKEQQTQIENLQQKVDRIGAFSEVVMAKLQVGLIEAKQLVIDGVDVMKKLTELSNKVIELSNTVESQQKQIEEMRKEIKMLDAGR